MPNTKGKASYSSPLSFLNKRSVGFPHKHESCFISDRFKRAKNLFRKDLKGHFGCVNAIEFSNAGGEWIASGGDDMRVLLWNTEKAMDDVCKAVSMKGQHHSNIFCLAFDSFNKKIYSGGNDEQVIVHDVASGETKDVYSHNDAVYGLSVDPCGESVFASACDDGRVLLFDTRAPPSEEPFCLANYMSAMHAVMFNPVEPRLVATANAREGLGLWDVRKPRTCLLRYGGSLSQQSCMSVRISRDGKRLIGLRRRLPPVLYDIHSAKALYQFDHSGYYNSCTMKSCCFAGDKDQYIVSGSDDFNLYVWKIPDEDSDALWVGEAHLVLKGHRSIVNQVRFNPSNHLIISSGVEKVVKMWSPYALPNSTGELGIGPSDLYSERAIYSHEEYIHLVLHSGHIMSHDYSNQSTEEDPRMMAFFDSLVQRELENWSSSDDSIGSTGGLYEPAYGFSESGSVSQEDGSSETLSDPASVLIPMEFSRRRNDRSSDSSSSSGSGGGSEEPFILDMDIHAADQRMIDRPDMHAIQVPSDETVHDDREISNTLSTEDSFNLTTNVENSSSSISQSTSRSQATSGAETSNNTSTSSNSTTSSTSTSTNNVSDTSGIVDTSTESNTPLPIRRRVTIIQMPRSDSNNRDSGISEPNGITVDEQRRTSISNLIKMKRTEYLNGIKKQEKKARRKKKIAQARRKEKIKRIIRARGGKVSSSDSDSDSSDTAAKPSTSNSLSCSSNGYLDMFSSEGQDHLQDTNRLKRRKLHNSSSDNESASDLPLHSTPKATVASNSSPLNLSLKRKRSRSISLKGECTSFKSYIPPAVYEDISNDSDDSTKNMQTYYADQTNSMNNVAKNGQSTPPEQTASSVGQDIEPQTEALNGTQNGSLLHNQFNGNGIPTNDSEDNPRLSAFYSVKSENSDRHHTCDDIKQSTSKCNGTSENTNNCNGTLETSIAPTNFQNGAQNLCQPIASTSISKHVSSNKLDMLSEGSYSKSITLGNSHGVIESNGHSNGFSTSSTISNTIADSDICANDKSDKATYSNGGTSLKICSKDVTTCKTDSENSLNIHENDRDSKPQFKTLKRDRTQRNYRR